MQSVTVLGYSVRALAQSAARAELAPHAIDLFGDRDLLSCCPAVKIEHYPRDLERALAAAPAGPWMYTGGLENHPALIERLSQIRPLWGNAAGIIRQVRRPEALAQVAHEAGCRIPQLKPVDHAALIKPRRGSGGADVRFASDRDFSNPPRGCILQEYIAGQSASAVFVGASGRAQLLGASRQLVGSDFQLPRPFLYAGSIGPLNLTARLVTALDCVGNALVRRFNLVGLFNVDFVLAGDELWLLEVNPRYSASVEVLERACDIPFVALHAAACSRGELVKNSPAFAGGYCGKAIVYADAAGEVPASIDALADLSFRTDGSPRLADIPQIGERLMAGQPVVTVLASGQTPGAVEAVLRSQVLAVQTLLRDYRGRLGSWGTGSAAGLMPRRSSSTKL